MRILILILVGIGIVQIICVDADDVVVVAQFTRFGRKSKIGYGWDSRWFESFKAEFPLILLLVLEFEFEGFVLEISEFGFSWDIRIAETPCGTAHIFLIFAIVAFVVGSVAIADHGHYVGEDSARTIVLVGVKEDTETFEFVNGAEDVALDAALFGEPHGEPITVKVALTMDLEFDFDLRKSCG